MLFAIWHGGRTLSGERGRYIHILIHRWHDMIPCVLRPDVGALGKKSEITSKMWDAKMTFTEREAPSLSRRGVWVR
jgi:hypothetical protein